MPIHDWSKVQAGLFHHFHQQWSAELCAALNDGRLPKGYDALIEQAAKEVFPDVLTVNQTDHDEPVTADETEGGLAVAVAPPKVRYSHRATEESVYAAKANRIVVHHPLGKVVAAIEIVSPGNKRGEQAFRAFLSKSLEYLRRGVHLLVVDLLPPSRRDPQGIHAALWNEIEDVPPLEFSSDRPLTLASYVAGLEPAYYFEPVAVGEAMRDMPLFLSAQRYVLVPLEASYQAAWMRSPRRFRDTVEQAGQA